MISNTIKALPLTEHKVSAWKNRVASSINANNVIAGSGIRVDYTLQGAVISLDTIDNSMPMRYVGDFDINAEYYPNQIVRVSIDKQYKNQNNANVPIGSTAFDSGSIIPISLGLFICVNYVPPAACDETTWLNTIIAPMFSQGIPFNLIQGTRFYAANVYYPVYPEIPSNYTASYSVANGTSTIIANNTFWQALPCGTSPVTVCIDNKIQTYYVMGYASGSSYLAKYLPYTP